MEEVIQEHPRDLRDKWIPWYFVAFFVVIAILDGIFVYLAVSTQTGVVTKRPYEKGLAFNETLAQARTQPDLEHKFSYKDGVLRWTLPIDDASVTASIVRPVQDGYDFEVAFINKGNGVYEAVPEMPLQGLWTARLKATWDNQKFQTRQEFIVR